ncbi:MAG: sugar ABC transporter permease, partial [Clostridiales bacterium]|nr:sugar ABC transporter permease [Clostridiales bacterium]
MRNFIGTIAEKVKNHYRKSGMIDAGGKIKNPLKVKIFIVCMLALPLLQFCIFTIYVNIDGIIMAFQSVNLDTNELEFVGLGNFQKFFKNFVSWDKDTFW